MINLKDPRQMDLFDRYSELLGPSAYRRLKEGWHGCFRDVILYLLSNPVEKLAEHFSMLGGPETKELFSMAGLMVVKDYFNWSAEEAIDSYNGDLFIQYALNISQGSEVSRATYFRYQKLFREDDSGLEVMRTVTDELLKRAKIDTSKQRLDSTHVFSNMAVWSRRKLIHHTTHDFLVQLKRHLRADYDALTEDFRGRYASSDGWCFAENSPMKTLHYGNTPATPDEQLGYDMRVLLERYAANPAVLNWTKYKIMDRVFSEQFVTDSRAELKKNPGGKILLNPSDPDAEIGHKGAGYQAQIMQTYGERNQVQMITDILPQGASASDMDSLPTMVERSVQAGTKPEVLLTDAGYGSDSNVCCSQLAGIRQIAPTTGKKKGQLGLEECAIDEFKRILICPGGKRPFKSTFTDGKGIAIFFKSTCENCPMKANCPAQKYGKQNYKWEYSEVNLRLRERRLNETTDSFKNEYRLRNGIEALNGNLKQNTALRRLRCRGRLAVHSAIYLIAAMHNIMRYAAYCLKNGLNPQNDGFAAIFSLLSAVTLIFSRFSEGGNRFLQASPSCICEKGPVASY